MWSEALATSGEDLAKDALLDGDVPSLVRSVAAVSKGNVIDTQSTMRVAHTLRDVYIVCPLWPITCSMWRAPVLPWRDLRFQ